MQRRYKLIVVFLLLFQGIISGQQNVKKFPEIKASLMTGDYHFLPGILRLPPKNSYPENHDAPSQGQTLLKVLPSAWYSTQLGFFCKKEWQLEKMIAVPFRFRIGSLDYVNYLEQKPNTVKPY